MISHVYSHDLLHYLIVAFKINADNPIGDKKLKNWWRAAIFCVMKILKE